MLSAKSPRVTLAIAEPNPAGQPDARQRLAAAIDEAAKAESIQAAEDAALARAKDMVRAAESDLAAAVAGVARAREALTQEMIAAAKNGAAATSDGTLAAARRREDQARDVLDAARSAVTSVAAHHSPGQATQRAAERLQAAAAEVIRPLIEPTIEAALQAYRQWIEARAQLYFLHSECFPGLPTPASHRVMNAANGDLFDEARPEVDDQWVQAFEALKRDASAPLPWGA